MRKELGNIEGYRGVFTGKVERFGSVTNKWGCRTTILLKDVADESGRPMTDHLWFTCGVLWDKIRPIENDKVKFHARVKEYYKRSGYDYRLSNPTKIEIVPSDPETPERIRHGIISDFCERFPSLAKKVRNADLSFYLAFLEAGLEPITPKDRPWVQDQREIVKYL